MAEFYNPYQFISVTGKINGKITPTTKYSELENTQIRHDYWDKQSYSGRIVCKITTETPTVVGNEQGINTKEAAGKVSQYQDINGHYALPANSLRGMVSSVAEMLSQSSLRVLNQSTYSVRKEVGEGLSAIGQIRCVEENGKKIYSLRPLCLPIIDIRDLKVIPNKWQDVFGKKNELCNWLPAYINGYVKNGARFSYQQNSFLDKHRSNCFRGKRDQLHYAKLPSINLVLSDNIDAQLLKGLNIKNGGFLLGQKIDYMQDNALITAKEYDEIDCETEKVKYTRGILHILGIDGRENEIPHTKKHEKFIPFPSANMPYKERDLDLSDEVINNFIKVAEKCADSSKNQDIKRPFLPQGYMAHKDIDNYWIPQGEELVYFDINNKGEVSEISYSSIWRKLIANDIYDSFATINKNTLPWGGHLRNPKKSGLTPAEILFGVVSEQKINEGTKSYNLASRVRFSDAKAEEETILQPEVTLKILASPKAPSPAMYFCGNERYVAKKNLNLMTQKANGRKVYLHHSEVNINKEIWKTDSQKEKDNLKQKVAVTPIGIGSSFYYHIDFNNLSWDELSLLVKSLDPDTNYTHRLGLGKSLGLGSVKNNICGLFLTDRTQRYKNINASRYSKKKVKGTWSEEISQQYPDESVAFDDPKVENLNKDYSTDLIDQDTLKALLLTGDRRITKDAVVSFPFRHSEGQQPNQEGEGFKWFVNNDDRKARDNGQVLKTVTTTKIPTLKST